MIYIVHFSSPSNFSSSHKSSKLFAFDLISIRQLINDLLAVIQWMLLITGYAKMHTLLISSFYIWCLKANLRKYLLYCLQCLVPSGAVRATIGATGYGHPFVYENKFATYLANRKVELLSPRQQRTKTRETTKSPTAASHLTTASSQADKTPPPTTRVPPTTIQYRPTDQRALVVVGVSGTRRPRQPTTHRPHSMSAEDSEIARQSRRRVSSWRSAPSVYIAFGTGLPRMRAASTRRGRVGCRRW